MHTQALEQGRNRTGQTPKLPQIPGSPLWGLYLPGALIVLLFAWWRCFPVYPGPALAAFALAAGILLVRANVAGAWERTVWLILAGFFLTAELGTAYQAHALAKSYVVCRLSDPEVAVFDVQGQDEIRSAWVTVIDVEKMRVLQNSHLENDIEFARAVRTVSLGNLFSGNGTALAIGIRPVTVRGGVARYRFIFSTQNGRWWEDLQSRIVAGKLLQAYRIHRYHGLHSKVVLEHEDAGFSNGPLPLDTPIDWAWAENEP